MSILTNGRFLFLTRYCANLCQM